VLHFRVKGKRGKVRFVPVQVLAQRLIEEYLVLAGHAADVSSRSLIVQESTSSLDHAGSLCLPDSSFSPWSRRARHIMASESFGFPICFSQFLPKKGCRGAVGIAAASSRQGDYRQATDSVMFLLQRLSYTAAVCATAAFAIDQRNASSVVHMRCRMTASLRATATLALFMPTRCASRRPQALRADPLFTRVNRIVAASYR
jgi:hypothetical protein